MYEHILVSETEGIVTITLNRPDKLNAFIGHMRRDLAEALEHAGSDRAVRVVIITGAGRAFCAGGDRKSTRLNSSHSQISYAVFCLIKKKKKKNKNRQK